MGRILGFVYMRSASLIVIVVVVAALSGAPVDAQPSARTALPTVRANKVDGETSKDFGGCSFACASSWKTRVSASISPKGALRYDASRLSDLDGSTAWASKGKGEWLEVVFEGKKDVASWTAPLRGFRVVNGYAKSPAAWRANSRVRSMRLDYNGRSRCRVTLLDTPDVQSVTFPEIAVHAGDRLRLTIDEVYPGASSPDTCISEIIFDGAH